MPQPNAAVKGGIVNSVQPSYLINAARAKKTLAAGVG